MSEIVHNILIEMCARACRPRYQHALKIIIAQLMHIRDDWQDRGNAYNSVDAAVAEGALRYLEHEQQGHLQRALLGAVLRPQAAGE